ncbi:MAG: thioredoxin-dependent thiol peroxidase [Pseudomonadota bacterium]
MSEDQVGQAIPDVTMVRPDGSEVSASDYKGKPWVLYFYPKDDTPGCTKEALQFTELKPEFDKLGVSILGVSKDPPKKHVKFIDKHSLAIDLASDEEVEMAEAMGVWVEKSMYGKTYMGLERSTFLIDAEGKIAQAWRKVKVKEHGAAVLEAARELVG